MSGGNGPALSGDNTNMSVDAEQEKDAIASPLSIGVTVAQREEIQRRAAEYGARVGRPVTVSEYVRIRILEDSDREAAA